MPVMSLGIRSGVNWIRVNSSERDWAKECTINVFARPGTPSKDAVSSGEDGHQQLIDDFGLSDDLPGDLFTNLVVGCSQLLQFGQIDLNGRGRGTQDRVSSSRWKIGRYL